MLVLWLIIDAISGYILMNYSVSISQPIRAIFFIYITILALTTLKNNKKIVVISLTMAMVLLNMIHVVVSSEYEIRNIVLTVKVMIPVLMILVLSDALEKERVDYNFVRLVVLINSIVLIANLYLVFFNIGFSNYGTDETGIIRGGTGYFFAGNEVAGAVLVLHALNLLIYYESKLWKTILINTVFIVASVALLSKSSILGSILIALLFYYFRYGVLKAVAAITPIVIIMVIALYELIGSYFAQAVSLWQYRYNETGAIYLFGGYKRWTAINEYIQKIIEQPLYILSGYGWTGNSENGFFDLFEAYGVVGAAIFFFWVILVFWVGFDRNTSSKVSHDRISFVVITLMLLITVSFFAGHIVQSQMMAPFLAFLYLFMVYWKHRECSNMNESFAKQRI